MGLIGKLVTVVPVSIAAVSCLAPVTAFPVIDYSQQRIFPSLTYTHTLSLSPSPTFSFCARLCAVSLSV